MTRKKHKSLLKNTSVPFEKTGEGSRLEQELQSPLSKKHLWSVALFVLLMIVYLINGDFLLGSDATANINIPVSLFNDGNLSFTPEEFPNLFHWEFKKPDGEQYGFPFKDWDTPVNGLLPGQLLENGQLKANSYCLVETRHKGVFANTFGIGAGLTGIPVYAFLKAIGSNHDENLKLLWYGGKVTASVLAAFSAIFIFQTALYFCSLGPALLISLIYGTATCVWSISSQTLWQHGPNEFFLAAGIYFLARLINSRDNAAIGCGIALACAVICRPTSAVFVIAVAIYLLIINRRAFLKFTLAGLPFAVIFFGYNYYYFGSVLETGQTIMGPITALHKTGSPDIWQTPFWHGFAGLLVSPSRGLFIYSPVMLFAIPSFFLIFTKDQYKWMIPITLAMICVMGIAFKWFDWWGGWTYGYRPLVDTMPVMALLLIPAMEWITKQKWIICVFALFIFWSVIVQYIGAFAYDLSGWNATPRDIYVAVFKDKSEKPFRADSKEQAVQKARKMQAVSIKRKKLDIDMQENRYRLWSISDNQILYYLRNFNEARKLKKRIINSL